MTNQKLKPVAAMVGVLCFVFFLSGISFGQKAEKKAFSINVFAGEKPQKHNRIAEERSELTGSSYPFVSSALSGRSTRFRREPDLKTHYFKTNETFEAYEARRHERSFAEGKFSIADEEPIPLNSFDAKKINADPPKLGRSSGRWVIPDGATEYGVEFGFAPDIATWMSGPKYYNIEDRGHILGAVRWGKILGTRAFVTYSWAVEIIPLNVALNNEVDNPNYLEGSVGEAPRNREHTWGVGINPASFRFIFFPQYRLRPQFGAGFGIVRHHSRVPTVEGTKMNFQVDFQIGGQYMLKEDKALNFGYRYYHFSNLYLFNFNPGYNVNMFFVGYSVFK